MGFHRRVFVLIFERVLRAYCKAATSDRGFDCGLFDTQPQKDRIPYSISSISSICALDAGRQLLSFPRRSMGTRYGMKNIHSFRSHAGAWERDNPRSLIPKPILPYRIT